MDAGIKYIYGNFGSDHPAILESLVEAKKSGKKMPEVITCPIEQIGLHMAMGYAHVNPSEGALIADHSKTTMRDCPCRSASSLLMRLMLVRHSESGRRNTQCL